MRFELVTLAAPDPRDHGFAGLLTPFGDAEELAELIPGARLFEVRGAAHGLMVEAPNAFNHAVLQFLERVSTEAVAGLDDVAGAGLASAARRTCVRNPPDTRITDARRIRRRG